MRTNEVKSAGARDHDDRIYVAVGDVIAGKYRVEGILGVGGMGFIVAATHIELEERVALKFLHREFLDNGDIIGRFTREAKAACKIKSEHVAHVHDVGSSGGAPFLVMEHLVGRDLGAILVESGRFAIDAAVDYALQTCAALAAAHGHGIVHRDIKPDNLFLVEDAAVRIIKVLDFGISKLAAARPGASADARLTGELSLGTPFYMSPEQIRSSRSVDARSDVWSLGVVLYELLTARPAFQGDNVTEVCAAVLEREPPALDALRPEVPVGLAEAIARCLRKDPADRFQSVTELAAALRPFSEAHTSSVLAPAEGARRPALTGTPVGSLHPITLQRTQDDVTVLPAGRPARRRRAGGMVVALLAAVAVGNVVWYRARLARVLPREPLVTSPVVVAAAASPESVPIAVAAIAPPRRADEAPSARPPAPALDRPRTRPSQTSRGAPAARPSPQPARVTPATASAASAPVAAVSAPSPMDTAPVAPRSSAPARPDLGY